MQVINSEISGKVCTLCNNGSTPNKLLKYYAGVGTSQYTGTPVVTLVTNNGVRVEVDGSTVDIRYPQKYQWKFSALNQYSNVGIMTNNIVTVGEEEFMYYKTPVSSAAYTLIKNMVSDAEKLTGFGTMTTMREWKKMSKDYYTNGHAGETFKRYNSYNGMLSKNGINTPRPHVTS